jgi:hypothetical protein
MHAEKDSEPAAETTPAYGNPSDANLDVEGPNEGAPGDEPRPEGDLRDDAPTDQGDSPS